MKISKSALIQYFYIYMMIQAAGGRIQAAVGNQIFYAVAFVLGALYLLKRWNSIAHRKTWFINWILLLSASLVISVLFTFGDLSIITAISYASRIMLVFAAVDMDADEFTTRFLKMTAVLCTASLITFIPCQIFGHEIFAPIYSKLYYIPNGNSWLGGTHGLFLFVFNFLDPTENAYMFGEPGEYQILVIAAIYILIFKYRDKMYSSTFKKYLILYLVTLITIKSTTGLMNGFVLLVAFILGRNNKIRRENKVILMVIAVFALIIGMRYITSTSYFYDTFVQKFTTSSSTGIDFSEGTGAGRWGGITRFFESVKEHPTDIIIGVGFEGFKKTSMGEFSAAGIVNSIMMLGIFTNIIVFGGMFVKSLQYSNDMVEFLAIVFIVINMGLGQPEVLCSIVILITLYSYLTDSSSVSEEYISGRRENGEMEQRDRCDKNHSNNTGCDWSRNHGRI